MECMRCVRQCLFSLLFMNADLSQLDAGLWMQSGREEKNSQPNSSSFSFFISF